MHRISVVVVDDSAFMRKAISQMLQSDERIEVVGIARNGEEGYQMVKTLRPQVVTLDIEMPVMDGLTALKKIMTDCPTSVIMISSLTQDGADATLKALEYGAIDFIPKNLSYISLDIVKIKDDLINKVKSIARKKSVYETLERLRKINTKVDRVGKTQAEYKLNGIENGYSAVCIGISTGGPLSLQKVIPRLNPKIKKPVFIVQHMPPMFTKSLAARLNTMSLYEVKEAEHEEVVKNTVIYIAPGGNHMKLRRVKTNEVRINISDSPSNTLHKPSVDVLLDSVVDVYGRSTLGVIMTGMGKDGLEAAKKLKSNGGQCIAQDEESCVIYGMPKAIVDSELADAILPLEKIADTINNGANYEK